MSCVISFSFQFIFPLSHCRVSFQSSMPEVIVKAYVSCLKRADARPLDLESATRMITGATTPIHICRTQLLKTGIEELEDAMTRDYENFDTRIPLEVNFSMESEFISILLCNGLRRCQDSGYMPYQWMEMECLMAMRPMLTMNEPNSINLFTWPCSTLDVGNQDYMV